MLVLKQSAHPFAETVARLQAAITGAGNVVFAVIDQAAAAKNAGLTLRPTTLIVFGNPKAGTLLMDAVPLVGLDLPLKLQVWEDGGTVNLAYTPMSEIAARYTLGGHEAVVAAIDAALTKLSDAVV